MAFRYPAAGSYTFDTQTGGDADSFLYTDQVVTDATLPQAADQDGYWCWTDIDTVSSNVGPEYGVGGDPDGYLYVEVSTGVAFDDECYLEFDTTLDASANNIEVQFKTNQRGDDNDATCQVQTNENGAGWVNRGAVFGGPDDPDKVATSGSQIWSQRSVDLTGLISHASTRIRIKLTMPSAGTIWNNDYGFDEIVFIGTTAVAKEQEGHHFRLDDGSESGASDIGAQDSNIEAIRAVNRRLRILTDMDGDAPAEAATLQYKKVADGAAEWRDVPE